MCTQLNGDLFSWNEMFSLTVYAAVPLNPDPLTFSDPWPVKWVPFKEHCGARWWQLITIEKPPLQPTVHTILTHHQENVPSTDIGSSKSEAKPTAWRIYWTVFLSHFVRSARPLRWTRVHQKEMIKNRRIEMVVERVVCLVCACWFYYLHSVTQISVIS